MSTAVQTNRLRNALPDVDSLFDHFFGPGAVRSSGPSTWGTPATVWEAEDKLHVELDVPGVQRNAVELTFDKGRLSIQVDRPAPEADEDRKVWHNERAFGRVTRTLSLPETVDPDTIEADLTDGVLHVTITKRPEAQPKRIEVRGA